MDDSLWTTAQIRPFASLLFSNPAAPRILVPMHDRGFVTPFEKLRHRMPMGRRDAVGAHRRFVLPRGHCPEREALCLPQFDPEVGGRTLGLSE